MKRSYVETVIDRNKEVKWKILGQLSWSWLNEKQDLQPELKKDTEKSEYRKLVAVNERRLPEKAAKIRVISGL